MATLLTNRRMPVSLQRRIEASVSGRLGPLAQTGRLTGPSRTALTRLVLLTVFVGVLVFFSTSYRENQRLLTAARAELKKEMAVQLALAGSGGNLGIDELETLVKSFANASVRSETIPEEVVRERLRNETLLYVRAPLGHARTGQLSQDLAEVRPDALALCFLSPARDVSEKALLAHVQKLYRGELSESALRLPLVPRPLVGVRLFQSSSYAAEIEHARSLVEVERLKNSWSKLPFREAKAVAEASLVLIALDEPKPEGEPSEIDGGSRHEIRLLLWDRRTRTALLRSSRSAAINWISEPRRGQFSKRLSDCRVGLEARVGGVVSEGETR